MPPWYEMNIHSPTMILLTSGIATICAACLANEWRKGREFPLLAWSAAFAFIAVGCALSLLRLSGSYFVGIWFTHGILIMAHALFLRGSLALANRRAGLWWLAGIPFWAFCYALPPDFGSAPALVLVNSVSVAFYALACAVVLIRMREASDSVRLLGSVFAIHALAYMIRAGLVGMQGGFVSIGRFEGFAISAMLFEGILVAVSLMALMLYVIRERRELNLLALARTDPLTGVFNRRAFMAAAAHHLGTANRGSAVPVSLLLFDLDNFKALNDAHGHSLGDVVLKRFCELAESQLRQDAVFARLGGEEFAALLPQTDPSKAESQACAIVHAFARECAIIDGQAVGATVSVGACTAHTGGSRVEEMLATADAALYAAKRLGRNRVETAAPMGRSVAATERPITWSPASRLAPVTSPVSARISSS